ICEENTYEGQAPMELEAAACEAGDERGFYPALLDASPKAGTLFTIRASAIIRGLVEDARKGTPREICAARFHNSVARMALDACRYIRERTNLKVVALSGGVFANTFLLERLAGQLESEGFEVLMNARVPAGDGGVSLGQAAIAAARVQWKREE
ncbi:MAG: carbamoyltransferase HypF, partial [Candidatus Sumerlaeota bacterium]|nr:carbamoyltransferase HypF [Candidatus Sumerlaeota bacterium]